MVKAKPAENYTLPWVISYKQSAFSEADFSRRHDYCVLLSLAVLDHCWITQEIVMPSNTKRSARGADAQDAIDMLLADHKKVKKLFSEFNKLKEDGADEDKSAIVEQICNELKIHAELEEEIFYPAVRKSIDDADLMDEALVEHAGAKELIAQLEEAKPNDDLYDAKVTVLGEQIAHHVKEEEGEMFPQAKKAKVDTAALGATMLKRKAALMEEMGINTEEEEDEDASAPARAGQR
jgi:hemerythrin superfamily protein